MSSSLTVMTSSTYRWMIAKLSSPGRLTAIPSAMVGVIVILVGSPLLNEIGYAAEFAACTPITRKVPPVPLAELLQRRRDPGDQAAAADRHDDRLEARAPGRGSPARECPARPRYRRGRKAG